jgi:hypothetical protein
VVRNGEMQNLPFEIPLCGQIVLDSDKAVHRVFGVSDGNDDLVGVVERAVLLPLMISSDQFPPDRRRSQRRP